LFVALKMKSFKKARAEERAVRVAFVGERQVSLTTLYLCLFTIILLH
jgi:hypothetical protein